VSYKKKVWQAGVMLLPVQSVGVMGDERTYESVVALRAVESTSKKISCPQGQLTSQLFPRDNLRSHGFKGNKTKSFLK